MLRRDFVDLSAKLAVASFTRVITSEARDLAVGPAQYPEARFEGTAPLAPPYLDAHAHVASPFVIAFHATIGGPRNVS